MARRTPAARPPTPVELRVHLPLLWPEGPDGPVDDDALRALGREYARSGRAMDELLADLDILCSVVGIGASSRMIEASSVAWSDAFLDLVAAGARRGGADDTALVPAPNAGVDDVVRRLAASRATVWGELATTECLLLVSWPPAAGQDPVGELADELGRVANEVHRVFPDAVVAPQPGRRRVVAAVAESAATQARVAVLRARCAELGTSAVPTVTVVAAPGGDAAARDLLRMAQ